MPIYMKKRIVKGWKAKERSRHGDCLVIQFIDYETDEIKFEWAMYLKDFGFISQAMKDVEILDQLHKHQMNHPEIAELDEALYLHVESVNASPSNKTVVSTCIKGGIKWD